MFITILISSSDKLDRIHLIIPEHLLIRTQFLTNAPHLATPPERSLIRTLFLTNAPHFAAPLSVPSFGPQFSAMPLILRRP